MKKLSLVFTLLFMVSPLYLFAQEMGSNATKSGDFGKYPSSYFDIGLRGAIGYAPNDQINDFVDGYYDEAIAEDLGGDYVAENTSANFLGGAFMYARYFFSHIGVGASVGGYQSVPAESKVSSETQPEEGSMKLQLTYTPIFGNLFLSVPFSQKFAMTLGAGVGYVKANLDWKWNDDIGSPYSEKSINETFSNTGTIYQATVEANYRWQQNVLVSGGVQGLFGELSDFDNDEYGVLENNDGDPLTVSFDGWLVYGQVSYLFF